MPSPTFPEVYVTRVAPMRFANRLTKRLFRRRNRNQVYMVWHQAICPYFNVPVRTLLGHQVYVCLIILVAEECLQTSISSLSNMMWHFRNYHTSNSGHEHILTILKTKSIIKYGVPGIQKVRSSTQSSTHAPSSNKPPYSASHPLLDRRLRILRSRRSGSGLMAYSSSGRCG